ncbi:MAG TPA: cation diffusion facilitator family transporter [Candidatus Avanaerovorax faecigallinarum]|nr:cation diffusion facilitator family transporter [Candidatus Avanaerovorax faecigallinarum]
MNSLICRLFVRDWENADDPDVRQRYGKLAGTLGIISNSILCIAKIITGIIAGSIAIIADGINNLTDASSSVITLAGFKLASMPEDDEHPYGHARIEYITGMIVSILIVVVGVELGKSSIEKIIHPEPVEFSVSAVVILVCAIIVKLWQASFNVYAGKRINSLTLTATGADSRNDVISTSAVLICLIVGKFTGFNIDGYAGCLVALFIIYSGITLVKETVSPLLGEKPDPMLISEISDMALSYEGVLGIHDLVVHNYGPGKIFVSIHIEVDADGDLMESHDLIDNIERDISKRLNVVMTAHMDPILRNDPLTDRFNTLMRETAEKYEGIGNLHDLRVVKGPTHTNIIFDVVVKPGCALSHEELKEIFQKAAYGEGENYYVVINFDNDYAGL